MTYQEFKNKYNGKYIDMDGQYGAQCWDLGQAYFTQCLGLPSWVLSGCGYVSRMLYPPKRNDLDIYFDEVSIYEMYQGDVVIWDDPTPHIAIFDNWDGKTNWYFSQNPNPSQIMECDLKGKMHAFRVKKKEQPKPEITPTVERDEYKNQIEVKVPELNVRNLPSKNGELLGHAKQGFYNYQEVISAEDYNWYKIADNQWVAFDEEWINVYPKKEKEKFIQLKVLDEKDGYALVDLGKVYIKKD